MWWTVSCARKRRPVWVTLSRAPDSTRYAARALAGTGVPFFVAPAGALGTRVFAETDNAASISLQWIEISANTTDSARHDQIIACTISTPRVSQPVAPI